MVNPPPHGATFFSAPLGGGGVHLRWERHSEFATYTFYRPATPEDLGRSFADDVVAVASVPPSWVSRIPGAVVSAVHIAVSEHTASCGAAEREEEQFREVKRLLAHYGHMTGAVLHSGAFRFNSNWLVKAGGYSHFMLYAVPQAANWMAVGKVTQRLIELEKVTALATATHGDEQAGSEAQHTAPRGTTLLRHAEAQPRASSASSCALRPRLLPLLRVTAVPHDGAQFALPLAQQLTPRIDKLAAELLGVMGSVERLGQMNSVSIGEQHELLHLLCELTADSLKLQALSS